MASQFLRKLTGIISLSFIALLLPVAVSAQTSEPYTIYWDEEPISFDNSPVMEDDDILVELRAILERLGYQVGWDEQSKTAFGLKNDLQIDFPIGRAEAIVNGEVKELPIHTRVVNGRTLIPLEFIIEEAGYEMIIDSSARAAYIKSEPATDEQLAPVSNITLNGFVELTGSVQDQVRYVRLDLTHSDSPDEIDHTFLEPMNSEVSALLQLPGGPGIYTLKIYTSTSNERYGRYRLLDTFKISYPEHPDLIIIPDADDTNRYLVRARLTPEAEEAVLQVKKLDRDAMMNVTLNDLEDQDTIDQEVVLLFGPGVYQVNLFELNDGNQTMKTATFRHTGDLGIELEEQSTENSQVAVKGRVAPEMRWMWIQYANPSKSLIRNAFVEIEGGKVEQPLHLNMGEGQYQIKIGFTNQESPYNHEYTAYESFEVENTDQRDRHLLPSESVESDMVEVLHLAQEIVADLESDEEKSRAIYEWVTRHIEFDAESFFAGDMQDDTAAEVLAQRETNGIGYARLSAALHRAAGLSARIVSGEVLIDEDWHKHAWNEVYIGDRWVIQDAALDAGGLNAETKTFRVAPGVEYFDPESERFALTHRKENVTME